MLEFLSRDIKRIFRIVVFRRIDLFTPKYQTTIHGIRAIPPQENIFLAGPHFSEVCAASGRLNTKVVPLPSSVSKKILPPCFFTTLL